MSAQPGFRPTFFESSAALREWLRENHARASELWVGMYKKGTGRPSVTWPEVVDQVLCFGWIDGIRKSVDAESYANRITPRRPGSNWSAVNVRRAKQLIEQGLMEPPGLAAFEARDEAKTREFAHAREHTALGEAHEAAFRANPAAWDFFQAQPPGYRRLATAWVVEAKREETRRRRLDTLIRDSANGLRIAQLRR